MLGLDVAFQVCAIFLVCVSAQTDPLVLNTCCSAEEVFKDGVCSSRSQLESNFPSALSVPYTLVGGNGNSDEGNDSVVIRFLAARTSLSCMDSREVRIPLLEANVSKETKFLPSGAIKYESQYYESNEFCTNGLHNESLEVIICEDKCGLPEGETCLPKCCEVGELLDVAHPSGRLKCVGSERYGHWKPSLYRDSKTRLSAEESRTKHIRYTHYPPRSWCKGGAFLMYQRDYNSYPKAPFRILTSGQVLYKVRTQWPTLSRGSYCVDGILPPSNEGQEGVEDVILHCPDPAEMDEGSSESSGYIIYIVSGCFTSAFFVLITITVYGLLWENQNFHGWTLLCSFVSLFFTYVLIGVMHLYHLYAERTQSSLGACWAIGISLHFFYLSTFTWMTAVNFDLWVTFSNLRPTIGTAGKNRGRFCLYAAFALGVPTLILTLTVTLDYLYRNEIYSDLILPNPDYGAEQCHLSRNQSQLVYQYGPVAVLLVLNLVFFLVTIVSVYKVQRTASIATNSSSSNRQTQSLRLFGKLFVISCSSFSFEVISFFCSPLSVPWYWAVFDTVNVCHGIFIFLIFVCKKSTVKSLRQKYSGFDKLVKGLSQCTDFASARVFKKPRNIKRSFTSTITTTFSLGRSTVRSRMDSNRKSIENPTEMSAASNLV